MYEGSAGDLQAAACFALCGPHVWVVRREMMEASATGLVACAEKPDCA